MAQRPVVPQFGKWDTEGNVPYTVYFENARKGKNGGKMINPNDVRQNPGMFAPPAPTTKNAPKEPIGRKAAARPKTLDITTGRSRMKPVFTGVESPDEGAAVPPFGGWNENDPSSADMYTQAFNKVRQEKNPKSSIESNKSARQAYATGRKANNYNKKFSWSSCFPCFSKSGGKESKYVL